MDPTVIANEFAAVTVSVVRHGRGLRLRLDDQDSGASVLLDPLDLHSFCVADEATQQDWLRTDVYRSEQDDR